MTAALAAAAQCLRAAAIAVDKAYDIHDDAVRKAEITAAALDSAVAARDRALLAVYAAEDAAAKVSA